MPKVSIIIPAYNALDYLPMTLASVLHQTFEDFEVIIINDGSSDAIEDWFAKTVHDPRVTLVSQVNNGPSAARNAGIQHAKGDYIAFLDADDLWEPDKLSKQVQILDEDPDAGLVYTWVSYIDPEGNPTGRIRKNVQEGKVWASLIQHNIVECGSVALVRQECFERVGVFNESLHIIEDIDMWLRIAEHYSFRCIPEPLVYYRQHTGSLSRNWQVMEDGYLKILERAFASTTPELLAIKARSYAQAYICLSWKPIQSKYRDYKESEKLLRKAIDYDPTVKRLGEYWRLTVSIKTIQYMGTKGYETLLAAAYRGRRWLNSINNGFSPSNKLPS